MVADSALPEGVDFAFVRQSGETHLFVKRSPMHEAQGQDVLGRAWACWKSVELEELADAL